eukprot:gene9085-biopygen9782
MAMLLCATAAARRPPARVAEGVMVAGVLCVVLMDANMAAGLNPRIWSTAVLLMDAGLVAGARAAVQRGVVAAVLAWLGVERVEAASRFGLYRATCFGDDAFCAEMDSQYGGGEIIPRCDCAAPPCVQRAAGAATAWVAMALVFVVDFVLTRSFATRMRDREGRASGPLLLLLVFRLPEAGLPRVGHHDRSAR